MAEEPTLEEWRRLYQASAAFGQQRPWEWMEETDLLGVQDPETGQVGYASVMGMLGEHFALAVYAGTEGLAGFLDMERNVLSPPERFLEVPHWQASWEDREVLMPEDREVIKRLGLKFRGRQAWPMFRSFLPGCVPWFLTGEEARFLALALEQALQVALRVGLDPGLLHNPDDEEAYLVRVPQEQGRQLVWKDEWLTPPPLAIEPLPATIDERELARWRDAARLDMIVEAELFPIPAAIREPDEERPRYGYALLVVDAQTGYALGVDVLTPKPCLEALWVRVPGSFLSLLTRLDGLPRQIHVRDERLFDLLEPVATGLSLKLGMRRRLPALDEARESLLDWMR